MLYALLKVPPSQPVTGTVVSLFEVGSTLSVPSTIVKQGRHQVMPIEHDYSQIGQQFP